MKKASKKREVLDRGILEELHLASAPLAPAPEQSAAIKQRVLEAARGESTAVARDYVTVRSGAGKWIDALATHRAGERRGGDVATGLMAQVLWR